MEKGFSMGGYQGGDEMGWGRKKHDEQIVNHEVEEGRSGGSQTDGLSVVCLIPGKARFCEQQSQRSIDYGAALCHDFQ